MIQKMIRKVLLQVIKKVQLLIRKVLHQQLLIKRQLQLKMPIKKVLQKRRMLEVQQIRERLRMQVKRVNDIIKILKWKKILKIN